MHYLNFTGNGGSVYQDLKISSLGLVSGNYSASIRVRSTSSSTPQTVQLKVIQLDAGGAVLGTPISTTATVGNTNYPWYYTDTDPTDTNLKGFGIYVQHTCQSPRSRLHNSCYR